jgi:hypothetical protein
MRQATQRRFSPAGMRASAGRQVRGGKLRDITRLNEGGKPCPLGHHLKWHSTVGDAVT